jgi:hypothetical protein
MKLLSTEWARTTAWATVWSSIASTSKISSTGIL